MWQKHLIATVSILALLGAGTTASVAASKPVVQTAGDKDAAAPLDGETRLVVFNYDANLTYNILTREGMMTHLELGEGERIQGFYLSDSNRWKHLVSKDQGRVFIKPTQPGLFNSATMVTNQRVYELTFVSSEASDKPKNKTPWYQRVRWSVSDFDRDSGAFEGVSDFAKAPRAASPMAPSASLDPAMQQASPTALGAGGPRVSPDKLNFGYAIEGTAPFRPVSVFDDGKFTWVQMSESPTLPAMFLTNEKSGLEIVNYTVHGRYLMVSQLVPGLLLRLGDAEIRITRKASCTGFWCSSKTDSHSANGQ